MKIKLELKEIDIMEKILGLLIQMEDDVKNYIKLENKEENEEIEVEKIILTTKVMIKHIEIYDEMRKIMGKDLKKDGEA